MKKIFFALILAVASLGIVNAQNVHLVMKSVLNNFNATRTMSADFTLKSSQINEKGTIVMSGTKFRILSKDYKCWYDGQKQWLYTTITDEVNILEPTKEELESNNPYFAVMRYNTNFSPSLHSQTATDYIIKLKSRNQYVDVTSIMLTIDKTSYLIKKAVATMIDDSTQTIELTNYKLNENINPSVFVFDSKLVPQGTQVIDLR